MSVIFNVFRHLSNRIKIWNKPNTKSNSKKAKSRFRNKLNFGTQSRKSRPFRWLVSLLAWFFGLMIVYSVGLKFIEGYDWSEAFWQGWQTFTTVGYGNAPPATVGGRIYTIILSTIGIAIVGAVFSAAFDYSHFLNELKRSGLVKNPYKNGYVLFNFPDTQQLGSFIRELRIVEPEAGICLVDNRLEELPKSIASMPNVHFIKGSTLEESTYEKACLRNNKVVIVFPQDPTIPDSDGATRTTVDLIEDFIDTESTRVIHVLVDPNNAWMFRKNKSTSVLEGFELLALIQECQDPFSAQIVEMLLLNTKGANPKTLVPKLIVGWTWGQLVGQCLKVSAQTKQYCTPFALVKNAEPITCPPLETIIEADMLLSIIAYNGFDWESFEKKLALSIA